MTSVLVLLVAIGTALTAAEADAYAEDLVALVLGAMLAQAKPEAVRRGE